MQAVASTSQQPYAYTGKDAAAKEREDRLLAAKKKLKLYRARTNQRMSAASTFSDASTATSGGSPIKASRRKSGLGSISSQADFAAKHAHRRSQSKSGLLAAMGGDSLVAASQGHGKRMSKSRLSRNSISLKKGGVTSGHGHTRSRASLSMSFSGPAPQLAPPSSATGDAFSDRPISPAPRTPQRPDGLGTPSSWLHGGFPTSPETTRPSSFSSLAHPPPPRSISPLPPPPPPGPPAKHGRHSSRHQRRSSVSNFRESLDIVSGGTLQDPSLLRPSVSSFADATASTSSPGSSPLPPIGWSNDPHHVLAALKERGRRESDDPTRSPEETRHAALEALEGRVSAPSEIISLGNGEPGELLVAPKSPGPTDAAASGAGPVGGVAAPAMLPASPMIGLGMIGAGGAPASQPQQQQAGKRSSWGSALGHAGASAAAQHSVMELGEIAEEDEEEDDGSAFGGSPRRRGSSRGRRTPTPVSSPKAASVRGSPSPRKSRPPSLYIEPRQSSLEAVLEDAEQQQQQQQQQQMTFQQRQLERAQTASPSPPPSRRASMRPLSLSLSSVASSGATPSTAGVHSAQTSPTALRAPSSPPDERAPSSPGEKRHISMFHSAAVSGLNPDASASPASTMSALPSQPRAGLRSLSIGAGVSTSPTITAERRFSAQAALGLGPASTPTRKVSPAPTNKRSSISYRTSTSSVSSLAATTPEGQKRAWRSSLAASTGTRGDGSSPAVSTSHYSSFPIGVTGGFGDLEVNGLDGDDHRSVSIASSPTHSRVASSVAGAEHVALTAAHDELAMLHAKLEQLEARNEQLAATHALEIAEFEKKASDEAREMRARIAQLEQQLDDERVARRFEVEGLQREANMAKEAIGDLTDERDALREDVDGWRGRCNGLELQVKKDREDEALAQAQAKLITEMRDQIYTLVAALERERGEHAETRKEVERILEDRVREAAADVQQHRAVPPPPRASLSLQKQQQQPVPPPPPTAQHQQQLSHASSLSASSAGGPASHKQPRPDDLALIMEEVEDDDDERDEGEHLGGAGGRHPFKTASDGSMLSTLSSSFGRSYSGNMTEDTSIMTDLDDSFSGKLPSPPSGHTSFSGGQFPPSTTANRASDSVALALGQLGTLAEEEEEDEEAAYGTQDATPLVDTSIARTSTDSSVSTSSDVMPRTPDKSSRAERHSRSHSFVRQWSFPKGSVSSTRVSLEEDDQSFFGYNKHDSLPPLPIGDHHVLQPFLSATLDVDETTFAFFPQQPTEGTVETAQHIRRPSSPRPLERINPHARRLSGQHRAPPPSPSALVSAAIQQQQQQHPPPPSSRLSQSSISSGPSPTKSRYSFGAIVGSIGGWSATAGEVPPPGLPAPASSRLSRQSLSAAGPLILEEDEGREEDVYIPAHGTPVQLQHQSQQQHRLRPIRPHEVPTPRAGRLSKLDFTGSACCFDQPVFVV
ncbi:hypothetical protein Rhopal_005211-T1 [Rhodotorula paludigena]|uniref:Proteophosphoglycan ppg4 n=1 Tax=Rhodotorula paludigena TaxID=86838 RepID=A0AAV5GHT0_9BASI|nr:hypothetical protein Rhopal_005211-T1 [Rhodotorula paludigena]